MNPSACDWFLGYVSVEVGQILTLDSLHESKVFVNSVLVM